MAISASKTPRGNRSARTSARPDANTPDPIKAALARVRGTLAGGGAGVEQTHYLVRGGVIHASNGRITTGTPFPCEGTFLVPAAAFNLLVDRMADGMELTLAGDMIEFRQGRLHGTIQTLPTDTLHIPPVSENWRLPPPGLLAALRMVRPFLAREDSGRPWAECACLSDDLIVATNNTALIAAECDNLLGGNVLLPSWAIDRFIEAPSPLARFAVDGDRVSAAWDDGTWMHARLVVGEFPRAAFDMLEGLPATPWEIPPDWRAALATVTAVTDYEVVIYADRIAGRRGAAFLECDIPSPTPGGAVSSIWGAKDLAAAVAVATHLDLMQWPDPCPFRGNGVSGLLSARKV